MEVFFLDFLKTSLIRRAVHLASLGILFSFFAACTPQILGERPSAKTMRLARENANANALRWNLEGSITSLSTLSAEWDLSTEEVSGVRAELFSGPGCATNLNAPVSASGALRSASFVSLSDGIYSFKVVVRTLSGGQNESPCSGPITVSLGGGGTPTPTPTPTAPTQPGSLTATGGLSNIALTWNASSGSGLITYTVLRSTAIDSAFETVSSNQLGTTFTDLTAVNGTLYYYFVTASIGSEQSEASNTASARAIAGFSITGVLVNNSAGPSALQVSWESAIGASAYTVKIGSATGAYPTTASTSATSPHTIYGLTPGTQYFVMVTATNTVGGGASVNAMSEGSGTPMSRPVISSLTSPASTEAVASWSGGIGAESFAVRYGTSSGSYGSTSSSSASSPHGITGLSADTAYYVMVTATNAFGSLDAGSESSVQTRIPPAPVLASASITNSNPTPIRGYLLSFGEITGSYSSYCILENTTDVSACSWITGTLPESFIVSSTENAKFLSIWIKDNYDQQSERVVTNEVSYLRARTSSLISAGYDHTCSIVSGSVWCWGALLTQMVGPGGEGLAGAYETVYNQSPVQIPGISDAVAVAAGNGFTCVLQAQGSVSCFGARALGSLQEENGSPAPVAVSGIENAIAISAGGGSTNGHACAVLATGEVQCWGIDTKGQLGPNAGSVTNGTPVGVTGIQGAVGISAGGEHSCALLANGGVKCWGANSNGQLGNRTMTDSATPVEVYASQGLGMDETLLSNAIGVSAGGAHTCVLLQDGSSTCFGDSHAYPAEGEISGISAVSSGGAHTCALDERGGVQCYGDNSQGQAGSSVGSKIAGIETAVEISAGWSHTCARLQDGNARCWGNKTAGQLGYQVQVSDGAVIPSPAFGESVRVAYPPILTSATITNSNPTQTQNFALEYGPVIGGVENEGRATYTHYCILENNTDIQACNANRGVLWIAGMLPNRYTVSQDQNTKVLSIWLLYSPNGEIDDRRRYLIGPRTDTNAVSFNADPPALASATITNSNPSPIRRFSLSYGAITGVYSQYCILENNTDLEACNANGGALWVSGSLPSAYLVTNTEDQKTLSIWLKDSLNRISPRVDTDAFTYQKTTMPPIVSSGGSHSCALKSNGTAWCWGWNNSGQLGNGSTADASTPVQVSGLTGATAISAGYVHTCALKSDGSTWCWGLNHHGQLGNGSTTSALTPVQVSGLTGATAISAGHAHTCAVKSDGTAWCWGWNEGGQLGNGSTDDALTPFQVSGLTGATAISAGYVHTCALKSDGSTWCWGKNDFGKLGNGSTTRSSTPVQVSGLTGATAISAGSHHNCALKSDGSAVCWGHNGSGQLGNGSTTNSSTPVQVSGLTDATSISAGPNHTCVILLDKSAKCWGSNSSGQLGTPPSPFISFDPSTVSDLTNAVAISAGGSNTCAILLDGSARCWGEGSSGQLGNGLMAIAPTPVGVFGLTTAVAIAAGGFYSCALKSEGDVWCWGYNYYGVLGNGSSIHSPTPVQVSGLTGATSVSAGSYHTCAVKSDGTAWCWGLNDNGQLGIGSTGNSSLPAQVSGLTGATVISAGSSHTCAVKSDGTAWCWGWNEGGQLGNGSTTNASTPVQVSGLADKAVGISAGQGHTCAILLDGTVWCWGQGVLGNGFFSGSSTPVKVSGLADKAVGISAGQGHTCAILLDGTAWCWGSNGDGQLGNGSTTSALTPVQVSGLTGATAISAAGNHTCAVKSDGTTWCWGSNYSGQLGNGSATNASTPVQVSGLTGATSISAGISHTCAVTFARSARCWGSATYGKLGSSMNDSRISTARSQVVGFDRDETPALSRIYTAQSSVGVGGAGSGVTLNVQLIQSSGEPWAGVTPTVIATNSGGDNVVSCMVSDGAGESTCKLSSTFAESKEIWLTSPVLTRLDSPADGRVGFTAGSGSAPSLRGHTLLRANTCSPQPYAIGFVDSYQNPSPTPNGGEITLSGSLYLTAYADPQCTIPLSGTFTFSNVESTALFYYKASAPGVYSIQSGYSIYGDSSGTILGQGFPLIVEP